MSKEIIDIKEGGIIKAFTKMGEFLQRHVFDRVSAISMGIPNSSPPKGFTTQGASSEYDELLKSVQITLNKSGQEIYEHLKEIYPEIDKQNNKQLKNELSSIGTLSNIFINNRTEAAHRVYETCKKMVEAHKKRKDKEAFINEVREFKNKISQFSTLSGLKRYLEELNKGFDD